MHGPVVKLSGVRGVIDKLVELVDFKFSRNHRYARRHLNGEAESFAVFVVGLGHGFGSTMQDENVFRPVHKD